MLKVSTVHMTGMMDVYQCVNVRNTCTQTFPQGQMRDECSGGERLPHCCTSSEQQRRIE